MIVVSKIERPLNTHERLLVAVPPFAERESGFAGAMRALKILADRAGMELVVLSTRAAIAPIMACVEQTAPRTPVRAHPVPQWSALVDALDALVEPTDALVLLSEREGSLAWRPSLNRLPGLIAQRFDRNTFLTAYMAELPFATVVSDTVDRLHPDTLYGAIRAGDVTVGLEEGPMDAVLRQVLVPLAREAPDAAERLVADLGRVESGYAPELRPGVVLYHVHAAQPEETRLLVGVSRAGIRLPRTARPAHVVLVFVGGAELSPEQYLQRLSVVTELVASDEMVDELRRCTCPEAARDVLVGSLREMEAVRA